MTIKIDTDDAAVQALVRGMLKQDAGCREGRATYLRTLTAALQIELGGAPRMSATRGRIRAALMPEALAGLAKVNERFYGIVVAELDPKLTPVERNAKSGFARSAASTLRTAIHAGINPLALILPTLTKESLREWTAEHTGMTETEAEATMRNTQRMIRRVVKNVNLAPSAERPALLRMIDSELAELDKPAARPRVKVARDAERLAA